MDRNNLTCTEDINTMSEQVVKIAYTQISEACPERKQKKRETWITADTYEAIENRGALKKIVMVTRLEWLRGDTSSSTEKQTRQ